MKPIILKIFHFSILFLTKSNNLKLTLCSFILKPCVFSYFCCHIKSYSASNGSKIEKNICFHKAGFPVFNHGKVTGIQKSSSSTFGRHVFVSLSSMHSSFYMQHLNSHRDSKYFYYHYSNKKVIFELLFFPKSMTRQR